MTAVAGHVKTTDGEQAPIVSRVSRLTHPPPLQRGAKLLVYGSGVPAPWNAHGPGGDKEEEEGQGKKGGLGDARLFATWEVETKDFRVGIGTRRTRSRVQRTSE